MSKICLSKKQMRAIATRRLKRDLIELRQQKDTLLCISAVPTDDNLFEWHANIKPHDGVYSGVFFHLILTFPDDYPNKPPNVRICTPLVHPNVFGGFICLSMLRPHTGNVPYEGWSAAYSITSVLMQLQSFLFADNIDQDGGYQVKAYRSSSHIARTMATCKSFTCHCGHSHTTPFPEVQDVEEKSIKVFPIDASAHYFNEVDFNGTYCQSTARNYISAYGQCGVNKKFGKVMFEVSIDWVSNIAADLMVGFGTEDTKYLGDKYSCGYRSDSINFHLNEKNQFRKGDVICAGLNFDKKIIQFFKNGEFLSQVDIPSHLRKGQLLYPTVSFKQCRIELNFGALKRPCDWLQKEGFRCLEDIAKQFGVGKDKKNINNKNKKVKDVAVDWINRDGIIDELWVDIFEYLTTQQIFSASFVCKKWHKVVGDYNIMERSEIYCYFSKQGLVKGKKQSQILGIGLSIKESEVGFQVLLSSQMDILSLDAWNNGCRIGVWGEAMTHFLPLAMNRAHAEYAHDEILKHLKLVCKTYKSIEMKSFFGKEREEKPNSLERAIKKSANLQMVDTLVTMMNKFVVEFVCGDKDTDAKSVNCVMCEKMVLGYCALHHLLLYLQSKYKKEVTTFANKTIELFKHRKSQGSAKWNTRDLGKVLIYLLLSKYQWSDIAESFIYESFTRRTRWFVSPKKHEGRYTIFDTTAFVNGRTGASLIACGTGRRLVMFQVWFLKNSMNETLQGYNQRLGRPTAKVRNGVVAKAKYIMNSNSYDDYLKDLDFKMYKSRGHVSAMDQMLRFAVWNSYNLGYHYKKGLRNWEYERIYRWVEPPKVVVGSRFNRRRNAIQLKTVKKSKPIQQTNGAIMQKAAKPMVTGRPRAQTQPKVQNIPKAVRRTNAQATAATKPKAEKRTKTTPKPNGKLSPNATPFLANQSPPRQTQQNITSKRAGSKYTPQPPIISRQLSGEHLQPTQMMRAPVIASKAKRVAKPAVNVTGRAKAKASTGLSKAQKRRMRMQKNKNGVQTQQKVETKQVKQLPMISNTISSQSTPSISAETPLQTPIPAPIQQFQPRAHIPVLSTLSVQLDVNMLSGPKLSKAQKRRLRMQKRKNSNGTNSGTVVQQAKSVSSGPTKPPMPNNPSKLVQSGPIKPPMSNKKCKKTAVKVEPKLSKAQKRRMRKNKVKNAA